MKVPRILSSVAPLAAGLCLFLLPACTSHRYQQLWDAEVDAWESGERNTVEGPWEGSWTSTNTGHEGRLKCVVLPEDGANGPTGAHKFRYWATWGVLLSGTFSPTFEVTREDGADTYRVDGTHDLPGSGVFDHKGVIRPGEFNAEYQAAGDRGSFHLKRPE